MSESVLCGTKVRDKQWKTALVFLFVKFQEWDLVPLSSASFILLATSRLLHPSGAAIYGNFKGGLKVTWFLISLCGDKQV